MRTLVALLTLVRIRWVVIIDVAVTPPLNIPRARPWLGCAPYYLESALLPAGHDSGNTVLHHWAVGKSRHRVGQPRIEKEPPPTIRIAPISTGTASTRSIRSTSNMATATASTRSTLVPSNP